MKKVKVSKSRRVYERRIAVASIYIILSFLIGFPITFIGSGMDSKTIHNAPMYFIGMILVISGISLLSLIMTVTDKNKKFRR